MCNRNKHLEKREEKIRHKACGNKTEIHSKNVTVSQPVIIACS